MMLNGWGKRLTNDVMEELGARGHVDMRDGREGRLHECERDMDAVYRDGGKK